MSRQLRETVTKAIEDAVHLEMPDNTQNINLQDILVKEKSAVVDFQLGDISHRMNFAENEQGEYESDGTIETISDPVDKGLEVKLDVEKSADEAKLVKTDEESPKDAVIDIDPASSEEVSDKEKEKSIENNEYVKSADLEGLMNAHFEKSLASQKDLFLLDIMKSAKKSPTDLIEDPKIEEQEELVENNVEKSADSVKPKKVWDENYF
jgi:hypothetical protein